MRFFYPPCPTHIDTLTVETPKGRRRIRRTLGLKSDTFVTSGDAHLAREKAAANERTNVRKVKVKKPAAE